MKNTFERNSFRERNEEWGIFRKGKWVMILSEKETEKDEKVKELQRD